MEAGQYIGFYKTKENQRKVKHLNTTHLLEKVGKTVLLSNGGGIFERKFFLNENQTFAIFIHYPLARSKMENRAQKWKIGVLSGGKGSTNCPCCLKDGKVQKISGQNGACLLDKGFHQFPIKNLPAHPID